VFQSGSSNECVIWDCDINYIDLQGGACSDSNFYTFFNNDNDTILPPVFGVCLFDISSETTQSIPYCESAPTLSTGIEFYFWSLYLLSILLTQQSEGCYFSDYGSLISQDDCEVFLLKKEIECLKSLICRFNTNQSQGGKWHSLAENEETCTDRIGCLFDPSFETMLPMSSSIDTHIRYDHEGKRADFSSLKKIVRSVVECRKAIMSGKRGDG